MSTCLRFTWVKTSLRHVHQGAIQDSSHQHKALTDALKAEALLIATNRKNETFPRLTPQDFAALAEHAEQIDHLKAISTANVVLSAQTQGFFQNATARLINWAPSNQPNHSTVLARQVCPFVCVSAASFPCARPLLMKGIPNGMSHG